MLRSKCFAFIVADSRNEISAAWAFRARPQNPILVVSVGFQCPSIDRATHRRHFQSGTPFRPCLAAIVARAEPPVRRFFLLARVHEQATVSEFDDLTFVATFVARHKPTALP